MARVYPAPTNEGHILKSDNTLSFDKKVLAESATPYKAGSVVVYSSSDSAYVLASAAALTANASGDIGIVSFNVDASEGDTAAKVLERFAEVHGSKLIFGAGADIDDVASKLAAKLIVVR